MRRVLLSLAILFAVARPVAAQPAPPPSAADAMLTSYLKAETEKLLEETRAVFPEFGRDGNRFDDELFGHGAHDVEQPGNACGQREIDDVPVGRQGIRSIDDQQFIGVP